MKFAPKEHSEEKVKKSLEKHNVPVFEGHQPAKFSQFGNVAKDIAAKSKKTYTTPDGEHVAPADKTFSYQQKAVYGGNIISSGSVDSRNPYAVSQPRGNPYAQNPYSDSQTDRSQDLRQNLYGKTSSEASNSHKNANPQPNQNIQYSNPNAYSNSGQSSYSSQNSYGTSSSNAYAHPNQNSGQYDQSQYGQTSSAYSTNQNVYSSQNGLSNQNALPKQSRYAPSVSSLNYTQTYFADSMEPIRRTQTNQSTASSAARIELFGSASRRADPNAAEFDELNRTHTELEEDDELHTTAQNLERPQFMTPASSLPSTILEEPEDELNQLPSEFQRPQDLGYERRPSQQQLFEDSEDEDVEYVKREIRQTKQETVESSRRALQIAAEAETSGRNAMGMLGDQGERLSNSANQVALGRVQARIGERNADELQRLNHSIFIPNVSNPFNSRRRNQLKEQKLRGEQEFDRLEREALEKQQRESENRIADGLNGSGYGYSETAMRVKQRMNRDNPQRKMYQFEADSDDDALEDELDQNLDGLSEAAKRLHGLSLKINDEVTDQNARIERMGGRVDELDQSLFRSTAKMTTIN